MIDTVALFGSLSQADEFTVTEDHLKLLRHARMYWQGGEGDGEPAIDWKRPYGNSNVPEDIAEILGVPDSDWEWIEERVTPVPGFPAAEPERFRQLRDGVEDRLLRVHVETGIALQIALVTGEFRPGRYRRADRRDWRRDENVRY